MEDALHRIKQWADAYPVDVFRPISDEKLKEANEALKAIGVDMGALHAGWARHIVDGIGNIARAALDANRTEDAWQPIETAPKDGTRIIIAWGGVTTTGRYLDNSKAPHMPWAGWVPVSGDPWPAGKPTHWQPLPAPPSRTEEKS